MRFAVKGIDKMQAVVHLELEAPSKQDAHKAAEHRGLAILGVRELRGLRLPWHAQRLDLVAFSQELAALLDAGLTLVDSVEALLEKESRPLVRGILAGLAEDMRHGRPLSDALQRHPQIFSELFVASIRASERTGDLAQALTRFITYQSQLDKLRSQVISASIYPVLLLLVSGMVAAFLLFYVVPKFSQIYDERSQSLPLLSSLLMHWGQFAEAHAASLLAIGVVVLALIGYGLSRPATRARLASGIARLPIFAERIRVYYLARFYRTVAMLLNSGLPILQALSLAEGLLAYPWLKHNLRAAAKRVSEGGSLSRALHEHALTTPVSVRMLRVGERSGEMGVMLERIALFMDQELARTVELFTRLFEPLLMTVIGIVIGAIVILMYFPIFELVSSIQ
jgi:general secretion pathway protein F